MVRADSDHDERYTYRDDGVEVVRADSEPDHDERCTETTESRCTETTESRWSEQTRTTTRGTRTETTETRWSGQTRSQTTTRGTHAYRDDGVEVVRADSDQTVASGASRPGDPDTRSAVTTDGEMLAAAGSVVCDVPPAADVNPARRQGEE